MELYQQAINLLLQAPATMRWAELKIAVERAMHKEPVAWDFPIKACQAIGAAPEMAVPAVAAITCAHMAIILVDDILDEDPRGEYLRIGNGRAANLAIGLNGLGINVLFTATECKHRNLAIHALSQMMANTAYGQELDVQNAGTEEAYWIVAHAKSSPYFATALFIGALFGNADPGVAEELKEFGDLFGEIMQIHDDLNDCLATPANVDWAQGRSPLPILFAELVEHPERARFLELRSQVQQPALLEEAQSILVRCGAISYSVNELIVRHEKAQQLLQVIPLVDKTGLEQLLEQAIAPVNHLFASVDALKAST